MHPCAVNEHPLHRAGCAARAAKNGDFSSCLAPPRCDATRPGPRRCTHVRGASPRLAEHLHYITEKGNPVVYLSDCNVAWGEGGCGGVLIGGVDRSCNLKRGHCSSEQKQLKENERWPPRVKNRKLSTCRLESTTLHPA